MLVDFENKRDNRFNREVGRRLKRQVRDMCRQVDGFNMSK